MDPTLLLSFEFKMQGLNGSSILAAAFDAVRSFRAYAWTDTGDILSLVIPHSTRASVCKASATSSV